jgi:hypothetical protein
MEFPMRVLIAILLALAASTAGAKDKETLEFSKDKFQIPECGAPYAGNPGSGIVTLLPEEVVCLAVTVIDGQVKLSIPPEGSHPEKLLVLKLWHDPKAGKSYLSVHNPLDQFLIYKAQLLREGSSAREYTTTCQVLSHRDGLEWWNYQLAEITLAAFSALPDAPTIECN